MKPKTHTSPQGTHWNTDPKAIRGLLDTLDAKAHDVYGWTTGGECLWCGESSRCTCDHGRKCPAAMLRYAPDLLAALTDLVALMGDTSDIRLWPRLSPIADRARAAIARAAGAA